MSISFATDVYYNTWVGVVPISDSNVLANIVGGNEAGQNISQLFQYNVALGNQAMISSISATYNVGMGSEVAAVTSNLGENIFLGTYAGKGAVGMYANTFVGLSAGAYQRTGSNNLFLGENTGLSGSNNQYSIAMGFNTYRNASGTSSNIVLGISSAPSIRQSSNVIAIGNNLGSFTNTADTLAIGHGSLSGFQGNSNIFIGNNIGTDTSANNLIAIGHGIPVAGLNGGVAIGNSERVMIYTKPNNVIQIGGTIASVSWDPQTDTITSNAVPKTKLVVNGILATPTYTLIDASTNGYTLPDDPYIILDASSTASSLNVNIDLSENLTKQSFNNDFILINNKPKSLSGEPPNVTLYGRFITGNDLATEAAVFSINGRSVNYFRKLLLVDLTQLGVSNQYKIAYVAF